jgi:hypothetical protein
MAAPAGVGLTGLDKGLAIAAAVVSLAALGTVVYRLYSQRHCCQLIIR